MNTALWMGVAGMAAFVAAAAVSVVARAALGKFRFEVFDAGDGTDTDAQSADGETRVHSVPSPHTLEDERLMDGGQTCFSCRKKPAVVDGLWCEADALRIHELDANDTRTLEDK